MMRTTLTIDDDLIPLIEDIRKKEGLSFKAAVNRLLRAGMALETRPPRNKPFKIKPHNLGLRAGFDATKLNQLADEIEADEHVSQRDSA